MAVHRDFGVKNVFFGKMAVERDFWVKNVFFLAVQMIFGLKMGFGGIAMQRDIWVKFGALGEKWAFKGSLG